MTPGWVDQHTHYDGQVTWDPYLSPSANAGVTTAIMGNCGIGFAPVRQSSQERAFLLGLVEAVEDIPQAALAVGIDWSWETFPQYLDKIDSTPLAMDVGVLIGHAPVRAYILGERASISDRPGGPLNNDITVDEIEQMATCVEEAVAHGAMGFSTSRLILHRDSSGSLTPGSLATESEMLALGRAVGQGGGGVIEGVFDFFLYDDIPFNKLDPDLMKKHGNREWSWMTSIAKEYDVPFSFAADSKNPRFHAMHHFNNELKLKNQEIKMFAQVFIRPQGMLYSFESRTNPFKFTKAWQNLLFQGDTVDLKQLTTPSIRNAIISELSTVLKGRSKFSKMVSKIIKLDNTYRWTPSYEPDKENSIAHTAKRLNVEPLELMYDWLCTDRNTGKVGKGVLWRPMFQEEPTLDVFQKSFEYEHALPGVADGGAHGTILTDATANTNFLSWWVRDRPESKGSKMNLATVVHKSTQAIARLYNMLDRGVIAEGMKADINVIDLNSINVNEPTYVHDLPTGAARWVQGVEGYRLTMCSGVVTFENGTATGKLPGHLVRNPKAIEVQRKGGLAPLRPYKELLSGIEIISNYKEKTEKDDAMGRTLDVILASDNVGASAVGKIRDALDQAQSKL